MRGIDAWMSRGQVVLLRADVNVPLDVPAITDDGRIRASLRPSPSWPDEARGCSSARSLGRPKGTSYG